jgi:uncharacterized membrane protein
MKRIFQEAIVLLLVTLPLGYLIKIYPLLPQVIPTHFGFDGKPNGYSEKRTIIWIIIAVDLISIVSYVLIRNLSRIDPKRTASLGSGNMQKIGVAVVALMSAIMIAILYSSLHGNMAFNRLFKTLMGMFFIVVGNLMYNIKPNYFVGIRVPWTLENEDNWRATHHLGGKLWVVGGILIAVCSPFLTGKTGEYIFMGTTLVLALVPIVYSFVYFKNHKTTL